MITIKFTTTTTTTTTITTTIITTLWVPWLVSHWVESHWVPHSFGLVPHLSKKLRKLPRLLLLRQDVCKQHK